MYSNYVMSEIDNVFEWVSSLTQDQKSCGLGMDHILINDLSVEFANSRDMSIQKMFMRGLGMVDLIQARALYKSGGLDELNKQMPANLWVEKPGIEHLKPFKVFKTPMGLRSYVQKLAYYLYVPELPMLDIVKYRALVGPGTSLPMNLYPAAY